MKLKPIACIALAAMLGACSTDSSKQTSATSTGGSADRLASSDPVLDAYVRSMRADLSQGKVSSITMKAVSPIADFSYDYQDLLFTPAQAGSP